MSPAYEALGDPCLEGLPIAQYDFVAGIILMVVFVMFFVEFFVMRFADVAEPHDDAPDPAANILDRAISQQKRKSADVGRRSIGNIPGQPGEEHLGHAKEHTDNADVSPSWEEHGIVPENYAAQLTAIFVLEFGVIFHSVFIGLTLAVSDYENFKVLYVVLVFHQTFEGLGLGSRLATVPWPRRRRWTPYALALAYGLTTPIAIAIGLGVRNTFQSDATKTRIINGVFDSISAGILIYTGLVELMAHEFMFSTEMRKAPIRVVLAAFALMALGAGKFTIRWMVSMRPTLGCWQLYGLYAACACDNSVFQWVLHRSLCTFDSGNCTRWKSGARCACMIDSASTSTRSNLCWAQNANTKPILLLLFIALVTRHTDPDILTVMAGPPLYWLSGFIYSQLFVSCPVPDKSFAGKTVIVTGSNNGLGLEASKHFSRLGAEKVILAVRNLSKGEAAKKEIEEETKCASTVVEVWQLDLSSYESVKQFSARCTKDLKRIDALVENAGIAQDKFSTVEDNEATITVNVVSTFLLALLMLPKLKQTAQQFNVRPNLVIVSSEVHFLPEFNERKSSDMFAELNGESTAVMQERYPVSKLLEVYASREIAELTGSPSIYQATSPSGAAKTQSDYPVTINFLNPGFCRSGLSKDIQTLGFRIMTLLLARTTEHGSRTLVSAAGAGPETHGEYLSDCIITKPSRPVVSDDGADTQKKVWRALIKKLEAIEPGVTTQAEPRKLGSSKQFRDVPEHGHLPSPTCLSSTMASAAAPERVLSASMPTHDGEPTESIGPSASGAPKPKRERVSQACEACRQQKARCRPSAVPGTCEKCLKASKQCIPHIPKTASAIGKGKRRSLAKMESRIEALYKLLDSASPDAQARLREAERALNGADGTSDDDDDGPSPPPALEPFEDMYNSPAGISGRSQTTASHHDSSGTAAALAEEWQSKALGGRPPRFPTAQNLDGMNVGGGERLAGRLIIALEWPFMTHKEEQLRNFSMLLPNFPFVNFPDSAPTWEMIDQHPMLTTAILVTTSTYNKPLQRACDDLYRNALAAKATVKGQKTLDILQSLLVFVAWHHHHFEIETQQVSSFISLACSMALDLRLDNYVASSRSGSNINTPADVDGIRAYLGCYYLSVASAGLGHNKPQAFPWSPTLDRCAAIVAAHGTSRFDQYMPAMVSLLHIAEDIKNSLRSAQTSTESIPANSDIRLTLSYAHLEARLRAWDTSFPTKDLTWLTPTRHFLSIYLFESALLPYNIPNSPSLSPQRHHDLLASCLSSARLFLDGVLASSGLIIDQLNLAVYSHVFAAIITTARLLRPLPPDIARLIHWDHAAAGSTVNISQYVDAIVERMRVQYTSLPPSQRGSGFDFFEKVTARIVDSVVLPDDREDEEYRTNTNTFDSIGHYAEAIKMGKPLRSKSMEGLAGVPVDDELFWSTFMDGGWMGDIGLM
ncbi:hypothetical protein FH972_021136 [Carpinus fangiana]|uniref:Zn(2)-C6 fungal-type domain-containing protein n=1 Tax=Carpinus fangiana TaxID=176857 RepID=A0A5N6KQL4_9ROSI|nr:hypothetical protein FH972_021136 [Carpinus fangiana]